MARPTQETGRPLGERLRTLRESQNRSLRDVAAKASVNHGYLSQLERGEVQEPGPSILHKIADGYGVPFVALMRWAGYVESVDPGLTQNQALALSYLGDDVTEEELTAIKAVLEAIRSGRATFANLAESLDGELNFQQRAAIRAEVLKLLRRSDALGVIPTPLEQVMNIAQLVAAGEITLEEEERRRLRRLFGSLLDRVVNSLRGVIHFRTREVWIHPDLHELKRRFVTAHEIGHDVLPWQRDAIAYLDDDQRLRPDVRIAYEREANQAAIELLAQGDVLRREADDSRLTIELLSELSAKYRVSMQAISRRITEETRHDAALAIRFRGQSGGLGPYHVYCSRSFSAKFGWSVAALPADARRAAKQARAIGLSTFFTPDLSARLVEMTAEAIDARYALLTLFTPHPTAPRRRLLRHR